METPADLLNRALILVIIGKLVYLGLANRLISAVTTLNSSRDDILFELHVAAWKLWFITPVLAMRATRTICGIPATLWFLAKFFIHVMPVVIKRKLWDHARWREAFAVPWTNGRRGYPARWMILSWIMLSSYVVGTMIGGSVQTSFSPQPVPLLSKHHFISHWQSWPCRTISKKSERIKAKRMRGREDTWVSSPYGPDDKDWYDEHNLNCYHEYLQATPEKVNYQEPSHADRYGRWAKRNKLPHVSDINDPTSKAVLEFIDNVKPHMRARSTPKPPKFTMTQGHWIAYYESALASIPSAKPTRFNYERNYAKEFGQIVEHEGASSILLADMFSPTGSATEGAILPSAFLAFKSAVTDDIGEAKARNYELILNGETVKDSKARARGYVAGLVSSTEQDKDDMWFDLLVDTGASIHISGFIEDFIGGLDGISELPPHKATVSGLGGGCPAKGIGVVRWKVKTSSGIQTIEGPGYYIPMAKVRLLSPQTLFRAHNSGKLTLDHVGMTMDLPGGGQLVISEFTTNLPFVKATADGREREEAITAHPAQTAPTDEDHRLLFAPNNTNLTPERRELKRLHDLSGHIGMHHLQDLIRDGQITARNKKAADCEPPKCAACLLGKMTKRSDGTTTVKKKAKPGIKGGDVEPGQCVSVDHYISKTRGRLPHTQGKEAEHRQYQGGTIFCDHMSNYISVQHQVLINGSETVKSKTRFEREAQTFGVQIKSYHADNGIFKSAEFVESLESRSQPIDYSGVGAHHQNGAAEASIRIISDRARAMIVHAAIYWPQEADPNLWGFAMDYATALYNVTPNRESKISPTELFSGTKQPNHVLDQARVWGCPAYVLEPVLQDGKKLPRWKRKSKVGQFLGFSKEHSSTVGLIRNLQTGYVSPQFHIVYDENFETIISNGQLTREMWERFDFANYLPSEEDPNQLLEIPEGAPAAAPEGAPAAAPEGAPVAAPEGAPVAAPEGAFGDDGAAVEATGGANQPPDFDETAAEEAAQEPTATRDDDEDDEDQQPGPRRSTRNRAPPSRLVPTMQGQRHEESAFTAEQANAAVLRNANRCRPTLDHHDVFLATLDHESEPTGSEARQYAQMAQLATDPDTGWVDELEPLAFAAKLNDDDTPSFREAMNGPDQAKLRAAMKVEWSQLLAKGTWDVVDRSEPLSKKSTIVGIQWVFKPDW
jgi:hypothetical protein